MSDPVKIWPPFYDRTATSPSEIKFNDIFCGYCYIKGYRNAADTPYISAWTTFCQYDRENKYEEYYRSVTYPEYSSFDIPNAYDGLRWRPGGYDGLVNFRLTIFNFSTSVSNVRMDVQVEKNRTSTVQAWRLDDTGFNLCNRYDFAYSYTMEITGIDISRSLETNLRFSPRVKVSTTTRDKISFFGFNFFWQIYRF